jgi:hypothetical protein
VALVGTRYDLTSPFLNLHLLGSFHHSLFSLFDLVEAVNRPQWLLLRDFMVSERERDRKAPCLAIVF